MRFLIIPALILGLQSAYAQIVEIDPDYTWPETKAVIFAAKKELALHCNVSIDSGVSKEDISVEWRKNGDLVSEVENLKNRFKTSQTELRFSLTIAESRYEDAGNWTCAALASGKEQSKKLINVASSIDVRIKTENINVVEEEKLRIECNVLGNPYPLISWRIDSSNYNESSELDERVKIEDYVDDTTTVENGVLIIEKVNKNDRGLYFCIATNRFYEKESLKAKSMVRIKDKYAALWPFLGICVEVVLLCTIIIIYEKKRNKTELEESDTDQSPDQKNTPDHGKDPNLRHRQ